MISRFNFRSKRLNFYENPEIFQKEFKNIVSSNNENEFLYTSKSPIVIINKDKTLKLTISRENKDLNYILYSNQSISILPEEKIKIHKALKDLSNFSIFKLNT